MQGKFAMGAAVLVAVGAGIVSTTAAADGFGLKPGLWEMHVIKQVMDGRDTSAQMASAGDKLQQAMAKMPPDQRAQMEAMMKQRGVDMSGGNLTVRMCITKEMASRNQPIVDKDGRCKPATVSRSGNTTSFEFNCSADGVTTTGKGEAVALGDSIKTQVDATTVSQGGQSHVMHSETQMQFIGANCGDVKPFGPPPTTP
jgi:hypothetical protein